MKNSSKIALFAFLIAVSFEACTKTDSVTPSAAPKTNTSATNKAGSSTLFKRDTITPLVKRDTITPLVITIKKDTITPIKLIVPLIGKRDTITPNY